MDILLPNHIKMYWIHQCEWNILWILQDKTTCKNCVERVIIFSTNSYKSKKISMGNKKCHLKVTTFFSFHQQQQFFLQLNNIIKKENFCVLITILESSTFTVIMNILYKIDMSQNCLYMLFWYPQKYNMLYFDSLMLFSCYTVTYHFPVLTA